MATAMAEKAEIVQTAEKTQGYLTNDSGKYFLMYFKSLTKWDPNHDWGQP